MSDQDRNAIFLFRSEVAIEREKQLRKWGAQTHTSPEWVAILGEEFGEVAKACCDQWIQGQPIGPLLKELIEVAAVAEGAYADLSTKENNHVHP